MLAIDHFPIFQNETILDSLNRVPWYLLPNNRKTEYLHLLLRIQSGKELNIGPFGILNYEMATNVRFIAISLEFFHENGFFFVLFQITKRIYSILTMMLEFTK